MPLLEMVWQPQNGNTKAKPRTQKLFGSACGVCDTKKQMEMHIRNFVGIPYLLIIYTFQQSL